MTDLWPCVLMLGLGVAASATADDGLMAQWAFDEGSGDILGDKSGNGQSGKIHGARWIKSDWGPALRFDGVDDYVESGNGPGLKPGDALSISVWVHRQTMPTEKHTVVLDKGGAYKIWVYPYINCHFEVAGTSCSGGVGEGQWHHLVATYDGSTARIYVNGKLRGKRESGRPIGASDGPLLIGRDAAGAKFFQGLIGGVAIHNRALGAAEIGAAYEKKAGAVIPLRRRVDRGPALAGEGYQLRVAAGGGMQVTIGDDVYFVESTYSYPGETIAHNHFSVARRQGDPLWRVEVRKLDDRRIRVAAGGAFYSIQRTIESRGHRVSISDTITNVGDDDVGVIVRNALLAAGGSTGCLLCGAPDSAVALRASENPTVFLSQPNSSLGALAEDNVSRAQIEVTETLNQGSFAVRHLGIPKGKRVTLEWALYPIGPGEDYWTFINRIREDWKVNFRVLGSWRQAHVTTPGYWERYSDPKLFAAYVKRSKCQIVAIAPYVDYDNFNNLTGKLATREEIKHLTRKIRKSVKSVDPAISVIGMIESPTLSLPENVIAELLPTFEADWRTMPTGFFEFTTEQTDILKRHPEAWDRCKDSALWTRDGRLKYEFYRRGGLPLFALFVRPSVGNGQHEYLMDQARFLIEDVGLDGIYVDSLTGQKDLSVGYSHDRWDGVTVDVDPVTGAIVSRYSDMCLAGAESRAEMIRYILDSGRVFVCNGHPTCRETQSLAAFRFNEAYAHISPSWWQVGEKPPLVGRICQAQLSSPIALGFRPHVLGKNPKEYASIIMKMVMAYLRHGVLYYHYGTDIPETGSGAGEYGALNHMYPITPKRLGEGFVEGEERIITCVSRTFDWTAPAEPKVLLFDIKGRPKTHDVKPQRVGKAWRVKIELADWSDIAVVE